MRILSNKKLYLPALSIVAVVFLLLVLISISTYRNLDREKAMAIHFFNRQGVALIHSIEASARTGMKMMMWQEASLGNLLQETAKDDDIAYVYLADGDGVVVHHSDPAEQGKPASWKPEVNWDEQVVTRIRTLGGGRQIYELAKLFAPMHEPSAIHHRGMMAYRQMAEPL